MRLQPLCSSQPNQKEKAEPPKYKQVSKKIRWHLHSDQRIFEHPEGRFRKRLWLRQNALNHLPPQQDNLSKNWSKMRGSELSFYFTNCVLTTFINIYLHLFLLPSWGWDHSDHDHPTRHQPQPAWLMSSAKSSDSSGMFDWLGLTWNANADQTQTTKLQQLQLHFSFSFTSSSLWGSRNILFTYQSWYPIRPSGSAETSERAARTSMSRFLWSSTTECLRCIPQKLTKSAKSTDYPTSPGRTPRAQTAKRLGKSSIVSLRGQELQCMEAWVVKTVKT